LTAAGRLLEREGVANITVQRVAEAANVDARLVRYYFDDLEGLMAVIAEFAVARWAEGYRQMVAGHDDPREAIADALHTAWTRLHRSDSVGRRQALVVQEVRLGSARNEGLRPLPRKAHAEVEAAWLELFERAAHRYEYKLPPAVLARMIYDAGDGIAGDYLTTGETEKAEGAVEGFITALSAMIVPR
jgi:AcrR family transcriptional regulator